MEWTVTAGRPVYLQLIEQLQLAIVAGEYPPGARLPAVRELAAAAQVNPNTMQRALQELESRGLVLTQRTVGRTITEDTELLKDLRKSSALELAQEFLRQVQGLGLSFEETLALLETAQKLLQAAQEAPHEEEK